MEEGWQNQRKWECDKKIPFGILCLHMENDYEILYANEYLLHLLFPDTPIACARRKNLKLPLSAEDKRRLGTHVKEAQKAGEAAVSIPVHCDIGRDKTISLLLSLGIQKMGNATILNASAFLLPANTGEFNHLSLERNPRGLSLHAIEQDRMARIVEALFSYEVNLSKDCLLRGDLPQMKSLGLELPCRYSEFVQKSAETAVYPEDRISLARVLSRENILMAFQNGKREIIHEYRRRDAGGAIVWISTTIHLLKDPESGDISGFFYSKDIDAQKRKEIELKRKAERDPLSGLYNRTTAQALIDSFLSSSINDKAVSALFMLDVDNFKQINDTFGHLFGDAVLSEIAHKLRLTFRSDDILSRIGGDEFVVFLKDAPEESYICQKAGDLCENLRLSYSSETQEHQISGSLGVALAPRHGISFEELYDRADMALYEAKKRGKNQYALYQDGATVNKNALIHNEIEGDFEKSFADSASEYIFKILYHSNNVEMAIRSVLELLAKHYKADRAYIMEYDEKKEDFSMTCEWHNKTIHPENIERRIQHENITHYYKNFDAFGLYCVEDTTKREQEIQQIPEEPGVRSFMQAVIASGSELKGFIGIEDYRMNRFFTKREKEIFLTAAEIIGTFILSSRNAKARENYTFALQAILDNLDSYLYVVHPETRALVFINRKAYDTLPSIRVGDFCYKALRGREKPCEDCPLSDLTPELQKSIHQIYNNRLDSWYETAATWIRWIDGERYCLVNSIDITQYKENKRK